MTIDDEIAEFKTHEQSHTLRVSIRKKISETILFLSQIISNEVQLALIRSSDGAIEDLQRLSQEALKIVGPDKADLDSWRPIWTAPRDGTKVLLYSNGDYYSGRWMSAISPMVGHWNCSGGGICAAPTYWMPLMTPPGNVVP